MSANQRDKRRFGPCARFAIDVVCLLLLSAAVSWCVALAWSAHGDWWIHAQTDFSNKAIHTLVRPVLSSDVSQAEDQLAFLIFWIPSFVLTTVLFLTVMWARRVLRR